MRFALLIALSLFSTVAHAGDKKVQNGCVTYFDLQEADSRLTKLAAFGNAGTGALKGNLVLPWPDGLDPLAPQKEVRVVFTDPRAAPNAVGLPAKPRTFTLQSVPMPNSELQDLRDWFARKGNKDFGGLCLDADRASYVVSIGMAASAAPGECPSPILGPDVNGNQNHNAFVCSMQTTSVFLFQKNSDVRVSVDDGVKPLLFYRVLSDYSNQTSVPVESPGKMNYFTLRPALIAMLKRLATMRNPS